MLTAQLTTYPLFAKVKMCHMLKAQLLTCFDLIPECHKSSDLKGSLCYNYALDVMRRNRTCYHDLIFGVPNRYLLSQEENS